MLHIDHTEVNARGPGRFVNVFTYMPEPECEQSASHDHTRANWRCMHRHTCEHRLTRMLIRYAWSAR